MIWLRIGLLRRFQHTAARRRLVSFADCSAVSRRVSTHSRPKAAGGMPDVVKRLIIVSTHSRPKAAGTSISPNLTGVKCFNTQPPEGGWADAKTYGQVNQVSTHSRPKAAGSWTTATSSGDCCFNTQPPEGGWTMLPIDDAPTPKFQHTAARRRLAPLPE